MRAHNVAASVFCRGCTLEHAKDETCSRDDGASQTHARRRECAPSGRIAIPRGKLGSAHAQDKSTASLQRACRERHVRSKACTTVGHLMRATARQVYSPSQPSPVTAQAWRLRGEESCGFSRRKARTSASVTGSVPAYPCRSGGVHWMSGSTEGEAAGEAEAERRSGRRSGGRGREAKRRRGSEAAGNECIPLVEDREPLASTWLTGVFVSALLCSALLHSHPPTPYETTRLRDYGTTRLRD